MEWKTRHVMDGWMDGWMGTYYGGRRNSCHMYTYIHGPDLRVVVCVCVCMYVCMYV